MNVYFGICTLEGFEALCIALDCCAFLFALVRVRAMLKKIAGVSLNVFYMALHVAVLIQLILIQVLMGFTYVNGGWMQAHWYAVSWFGHII